MVCRLPRNETLSDKEAECCSCPSVPCQVASAGPITVRKSGFGVTDVLVDGVCEVTTKRVAFHDACVVRFGI